MFGRNSFTARRIRAPPRCRDENSQEVSHETDSPLPRGLIIVTRNGRSRQRLGLRGHSRQQHGAIDACYETKGGALRVIDAEGGDTCKKKETPLAWPTKVNTFIRTLAFTTPEGYGSVATVACNPGEVATGGGYLLGSGIPMDRIPTVIASQPHGPVANPTEWQVRWYWTPAGEQWEIYVVCAKLP